MKIEFTSLRREMLLFLTTNMAAVTPRANQQYSVFYIYVKLIWPNFMLKVSYTFFLSLFSPDQECQKIFQARFPIDTETIKTKVCRKVSSCFAATVTRLQGSHAP